MGFYKDPYQRFGTLNDEMLRAMRLVVDSGIHAKGWTRDQAIKYMLDNSGMGRTDATAEVERYIAIPSQATAYKVGSLTIQRLRDKAKAELGDKFDIREFHAQVLNTGALPCRSSSRRSTAGSRRRRRASLRSVRRRVRTSLRVSRSAFRSDGPWERTPAVRPRRR
nr:DUF885 domain-containing protein [Sphingomonas daechungensis]